MNCKFHFGGGDSHHRHIRSCAYGRYGGQLSVTVIFGGRVTRKGRNDQHALRINAVTISLVEIFCENQPGFRIQILFPVWSIAYRSHSRFACPILLKAMNAIKCGYAPN